MVFAKYAASVESFSGLSEHIPVAVDASVVLYVAFRIHCMRLRELITMAPPVGVEMNAGDAVGRGEP